MEGMEGMEGKERKEAPSPSRLKDEVEDKFNSVSVTSCVEHSSDTYENGSVIFV